MALTLSLLAFHGKNCQIPSLIDGLFSRLSGSSPVIHAIALALGWLNSSRHGNQKWSPDKQQLQQLISIAENPDCDKEALRYICWIFRSEHPPEAVNALLLHLSTSSPETTKYIIETLGAIGNEQCVSALKTTLQNSDINVRKACLGALAQSCTDNIDRQLLSNNFDGKSEWLDPLYPINSKRIANAAKKLKRPVKEIEKRYTALAERFGLKLSRHIT